MSLSSLFNLFKKNDKKHWEKIYNTYAPNEVGWYQEKPSVSLELIQKTGVGFDAHIIDIGGGASLLAEALLEEGYQHLTMFDISSQALHAVQQIMGDKAKKVQWIEGDITSHVFEQQYDIWHDRAVFHFLTEEEDRQNYFQSLNKTLFANGHFIIATFSPEAPPKCSGLPVVRYSVETLKQTIGNGFKLISSREELHRTPGNTEQKFIYCHFLKS